MTFVQFCILSLFHCCWRLGQSSQLNVCDPDFWWWAESMGPPWSWNVMKTTTQLADICRLTLEAYPCEVKQCWRLSDVGALRLSTDWQYLGSFRWSSRDHTLLQDQDIVTYCTMAVTGTTTSDNQRQLSSTIQLPSADQNHTELDWPLDMRAEKLILDFAEALGNERFERIWKGPFWKNVLVSKQRPSDVVALMAAKTHETWMQNLKWMYLEESFNCCSTSTAACFRDS